MDREDVRARTRAFVLRFIRGRPLGDAENLFETGYVNSMFAMQLVQFVESEFGIAVEDADLEIENFRSIDAIAALVGRKAAGARAA